MDRKTTPPLAHVARSLGYEWRGQGTDDAAAVVLSMAASGISLEQALRQPGTLLDGLLELKGRKAFYFDEPGSLAPLIGALKKSGARR